ncbi:hypothetical protein [Enterobacter phage ST22]|nr:hypothetical protein [Enterobacter phage ST22]
MKPEIKIFNPRSLLRKGSGEMLAAAAEGHHVFVRSGALVKGGRPVMSCEHGNSVAAYGAEVAGKVFKLVEVPPEELADWQRQLDAQTGPTA